jgi:hypothetical protein
MIQKYHRWLRGAPLKTLESSQSRRDKRLRPLHTCRRRHGSRARRAADRHGSERLVSFRGNGIRFIYKIRLHYCRLSLTRCLYIPVRSNFNRLSLRGVRRARMGRFVHGMLGGCICWF